MATPGIFVWGYIPGGLGDRSPPETIKEFCTIHPLILDQVLRRRLSDILQGWGL